MRTHIGIEQKLKLDIENTQSQYEVLEDFNSRPKKDSGQLSRGKSQLEKKENEIKALREKIVEMEKEAKRREGEFCKNSSENVRLKKYWKKREGG